MPIWIKKKILNSSGYALPSVLMINLLVVTSIMGLLTIIFFYDGLSMRMIEKKKLDLASYSALQMLLSDTTGITAGMSTYTIDSISVVTDTKMAGFYWEVTSTAQGINDSSKIRYLIGSTVKYSKYFTNALVISRPNLRATVAGDTRITGNILATSNRIVKGRIFGEPPVAGDYLDGEVIIENDIPVQLAQDSIFDRIYDDFVTGGSTYLEYESLILDENYIQALITSKPLNLSGSLQMRGNLNSGEHKEAINIYAEGKVNIQDETHSDVDLSIVTKSEVNIGKNVHLENALIFAYGTINIDSDSYFKNVQFFSHNKITIANSQFDYPSIICLNIDASDSTILNNSLEISSSIVNGSILLMTSSSGLSSNKSKIKIDDESKVQGLIYSENNLELLGDVYGSVYTYNFRFYKEPTEYINWLVNVKVDRNKLSDWFLVPVVFAETNNFEILKETCIY